MFQIKVSIFIQISPLKAPSLWLFRIYSLCSITVHSFPFFSGTSAAAKPASRRTPSPPNNHLCVFSLLPPSPLPPLSVASTPQHSISLFFLHHRHAATRTCRTPSRGLSKFFFILLLFFIYNLIMNRTINFFKCIYSFNSRGLLL